jgi:hypothetical protein
MNKAAQPVAYITNIHDGFFTAASLDHSVILKSGTVLYLESPEQKIRRCAKALLEALDTKLPLFQSHYGAAERFNLRLALDIDTTPNEENI